MLREIYNACSTYVHAPLDAFDKEKSDPERSAALKKFASFILVAPLVVAGLVTLVGRACIGISDALSKKVDEVAIKTPPLDKAQGAGAKPTFSADDSLQAQHNAIKESILKNTSIYFTTDGPQTPRAGDQTFRNNPVVKSLCEKCKKKMNAKIEEKEAQAHPSEDLIKETGAAISTFINVERIYRNTDFADIMKVVTNFPTPHEENSVMARYNEAIRMLNDLESQAANSYFKLISEDKPQDKVEELKATCLKKMNESEAAFQEFLPQLESFMAQGSLYPSEVEEIQKVINTNITETWIRRKELGAN